jgi:hypothetical protein
MLTTTRGPFHRTVTDTPLARQLTKEVEQRNGRKRRKIPWKQFRRRDYTEPALALAYDAQRMLATGEYLAVEGFSRLTGSLAHHGAPFDLIAAAASIPSDEIAHAEIAVRMAALCADKQRDEVDLEVRKMRPKGDSAIFSIEELDRVMTLTSAVGETISAALLSACGAQASDPVARALFDTIVADEVRHARLGWYYLEWRAPRWSASEHGRIAAIVREHVRGLEVRFGRGRDAPRGSKKSARALGVLATAPQRETVAEVVEEQIVPALDALGMDAGSAWRERKRVED